MNIFQKAKVKVKETKEKAKNWLDEHPNVYGGLLIGGHILVWSAIIGGSALLSKKTHESCDEPAISANENANSYEISPKWQRVFDAEEEYGEDYDDHFNRVVEFFNQLDLKPGEGYYVSVDDDDDGNIEAVHVTQDVYMEERKYQET